MSTPYLGELRLFPFSLCPANWFPCAGQLLPVSDYAGLFAVLNTTYGGDGVETFGLPDLRSRTPVHIGQAGGLSYTLGMTAGAEQTLITWPQMPWHAHPIQISTAGGGDQSSPANNFIAPIGNASALNPPAYYTGFGEGQDVRLAFPTIGEAGAAVPHSNLQPVLALAICICASGNLPS
jgi:microcystin-dependent protein